MRTRQSEPVTAEEALLRLAGALRALDYRFTTVTPATHERVNRRPGNQYARDLQGVFGWSRPFMPALLPAPLFDLMRAAGVAMPEGDAWRSLIRFATLDDALYVHSAYPTAAADAVFFGPDTYRFAAAIRACVATLPAAGPATRAIDIGCGAGPGALTVARLWPEAEVLAVDINEAALRLTRLNATLAGAAHVVARHSDLFDGVHGRFDLVVANPPYLVDAHERAYRHGGGPLGADLSLAIVDAALHRLAPGGTLLLYTGAAIVAGRDPLRDAVAERLDPAAGAWSYREIDPDVFGEELAGGAYAEADRIAAVEVRFTRAAGDWQEDPAVSV